MLSFVRLNSGFVTVDTDTNAPATAAYSPTSDDDADREPFGDCNLMQCLGVTSLPYGPTDSGHAEGIVAENVAGLPGVVVAAWDTRNHSIVGNLKPGDTVVHATGPSRAAQLQLKEETRQALLTTRGKNGKQLYLLLDGDERTLQVNANGALIQIDEDGTIALSSKNGANGITINDDCVHVRGNVVLGGMAPIPGQAIALCPPPGGSGSALQFKTASGVMVGA